jgi:hypothetical protein
MKKDVNINSLLDGFISSAVVGLGSTQNNSMPVIEFAEDIIFNGTAHLFPQQSAVLKSFYNEPLNEAESLIMAEWAKEERSNWVKNRQYKNFVLEAGRGSSKSTLASIICLYEFYSLITLSNPSRHYGLLPNDPIAIFVIAQTLEQVKDTLFAKIRGYAFDSLFFKSLADAGKIEILAESIKCPAKNVAIYAKHTNSPALVGYTIKAMILDEYARFQNVVGEGGEITSVGDLLWSNIGNGCNRFGHLGHKVAISSAWDVGDPMERLIDDTKEDPQTFTLRLRTWDLNKLPSVSREASNSEYIKNRIKAELEFEGIRRKASAGFISADLCQKASIGNSCIDTREIDINSSNDQGDKFYVGIESTRIESDSMARSFIHVDFSVKRDATALAICHAIELEPSRWGIQLDGLIRWKPHIDHQGYQRHVSYENVERLILELAKARGASKITFDQFNSESSIQKLHMLGYATQQMSVTRANQLTYYTTFRDLLTQGLLILPKDSIYIATLITELSEIVIKPNGQITHDIAGKDMADAAVNAIYACYMDMISSGRSVGQTVTISKVKSQSIHTLHNSTRASSARLGIGKAIGRLHKGR